MYLYLWLCIRMRTLHTTLVWVCAAEIRAVFVPANNWQSKLKISAWSISICISAAVRVSVSESVLRVSPFATMSSLCCVVCVCAGVCAGACRTFHYRNVCVRAPRRNDNEGLSSAGRLPAEVTRSLALFILKFKRLTNKSGTRERLRIKCVKFGPRRMCQPANK